MIEINENEAAFIWALMNKITAQGEDDAETKTSLMTKCLPAYKAKLREVKENGKLTSA